MHIWKSHYFLFAFMLGLMFSVSVCNGADAVVSSNVAKTKQPNIIILTVDTLRADHIAMYGYDRNTMPAIEDFARTSVVFDNAIVTRGATVPSYASMLTGLYPYRHGIHTNKAALHEDLATLPELLKSAGYHTAGFVSNFVLISELSACDQGFDVYDDNMEEPELYRENYERSAPNTARAISQWLQDDPPQPFMLFVNFIDPHGPYRPPARFSQLYKTSQKRILDYQKIPNYQLLDKPLNLYDHLKRILRHRHIKKNQFLDKSLNFYERLKRMLNRWKARKSQDKSLNVHDRPKRALKRQKIQKKYSRKSLNFYDYLNGYDAEIRYTDEVIGKLIEQLKSKKLWDDSLIIFTADHGEAMGEHDFFFEHQWHVYDETMRVPLIIRLPRQTADHEIRTTKRISSLASPMDLMPTIADYLDIPFDDEVDGQSLLPIIMGKQDNERFLFLESHAQKFYAVRSATHKLIRVMDGNTDQVEQEIFDISTDPLEQKPIRYDKGQKIHRKLLSQMDSMVKKVHDYELPFTLSLYMIPMSNRDEFMEKRKDKDINIKQLSPEQIKRLRSLGYVK